MAGYTRQDTDNKIANGRVIDADDFDAEYNALADAFNASTGHSHDGTSGEGAPIEKVGPSQELVVTATSLLPKATNTLDLGTNAVQFKNAWFDGTVDTDILTVSANATVGGTLGVTGVITATGGLTGTVTGNVTGDLTGDVTGDVTGNVTGNLTGNVTGDVTGDVTGTLTGNVTGDVTGDVTGNLVGNVTGDVTGTVSDISNHDTDVVSEGSNNLYYTNARVRNAISVAGSLSYNSSTGLISYTQGNTDTVSEGTTNRYFTDERVDDRVSNLIVGGTNITTSYDDSTNTLTISATNSGGFDLSNNDTDDLSEGSSNLYYTATRARNAVSVSDSGGDGSLSYNSGTGVITYTGPSASQVRAHFSAGTGVTYSSGQFSIGQAVGTTSNVTFGNATINGNLIVNGTTTTVNSNNVNIGDATLTLNSDETGVPSQDAGITIERGTSVNKSFLWDESEGEWSTFGERIKAGTFEGALSGNATTATTATRLATSRTISLGGDVSGSASFNGTSNITITAVVANNSHTHTLSNISGITATTTEINKLDGFTGTVTDLNYAKDLRATGVTATEFNYIDGVTSNVQTQLNAKADDSTTISAGGGLTGGGSIGSNRTISHADTSSQGSVNNSGNKVIQDITVDTYGHITDINSKTIDITTSDVLAATAGAGVGAVGTYALLYASTAATRNQGATLSASGSSLKYAATLAYGTSAYRNSSPSGTWRLMGVTGYNEGSAQATNDKQTSVWLRIS